MATSQTGQRVAAQDAGEVQQAIGVIMEYATVDAATPLHRLRAYALHSRRPMHDVVSEVRTDHCPSPQQRPDPGALAEYRDVAWP